MFKDSVCIFIVFSLCKLFCATYGQYWEEPELPPIACPNYFEYVKDDGIYYGKITLPRIYMGTTQVNVELSQQSLVKSSTSGRLSLEEDKRTTINNLKNGDPVSYHVEFPLRDVVPKLTRIAVNDKVICSASEYPTPRRTLRLRHTFNYTSSSLQQRTQFENPYYGSAYEQIEQDDPVVERVYSTKTKTTTSTTTARPKKKKNYAVCGQAGAAKNSFTPFIFGGTPLRRGEYPWLTAIYRKHVSGVNFICAGSLISSSLVLSAAHCFDVLTSDKISVTLGRHNLSNSMEKVVSRDIESIIKHPDYKPRDSRFSDADLALLRMYTVVSFTRLIRSICLWTESADESLIVGQSAMVAGWGTDESNTISPVPKKVDSNIVSDRECYSSPHGFGNITTERTLCAGNLDGTGPCHGDSGGPLMMLRNNRWVLRGIVSVGQTEQLRCNLLQYVLYCDVAKHITWVKDYLQP